MLSLIFFSTCLFSAALFATQKINVTITGIGPEVQKNIKLLLSDVESSDQLSQRSLKKKVAKAMINGSEPFGFYNVAYDIHIEANEIVIAVKDFSTIYWTAVNIEIRGTAKNEPELKKLIVSAANNIGDRMNHEFYEKLKSQLITICLNKGYLDARFHKAAIEVSSKNATADIILTIESGEQYYYAAPIFKGGQLTAVFLNKMTTVKVGQPYRRSEVERFYQQLIDTRYFTSVKFERQKNSDYTITLVVVLEASPRFRYSTGVGFATDVGPRVKVGLERPWINSNGHQLKVQGEFSTKIRSASSKYRVPLYKGWVDSFSWSTGWQNKQVEGTGSETFTTGFGLHREIRRWVGSVSFNIESERYSQGGLLTDEVSFAYVGTQWSRTRIWGSARNPMRGYKLWVNVEGSTEDLGSETDFYSVEMGSKWLQSMGEKQSLLFKGGLGFIDAGDFKEITATKRFYVGGDQTIRGYDYESLSPTSEDGVLLGGRYLNTIGLEYRYQCLPSWQISVFTDAGRAYDSSDEKVKVGAGIGVRWISPIGPLNIDVAYPIEDSLHDSPRLHVYMGPVI